VKPLTVARDLQRRRARERTGLFLAEGVRCVEELIASPLRVKSVVLAPELRSTERGRALDAMLRSVAAARDFEVVDVTDSERAGGSATDNPQGVLAIAERPERSFDSVETEGVILVLDGVQDPGNVGTMLRTAQAFGVAATVALDGTVDLWNPKVVRSAMGALFTHNAFSAQVAPLLEFIRAHRFELWATGADGEPIARTRVGQRLAVVVGNEAGGITDQMKVAADRTVAIPIRGVESLNVAVATGILLYAVTAA
jgi:TrmH family RNA methyltransferase